MALGRGLGRHKLVITKMGYMGLARRGARVGDVCAVLFGGAIPFLLRKVDEHYTLVSECFTRGLMEGQAVEMWKRGDIKDIMFDIH